MEESARFMRTIGMRPIFQGPEVSVYDATHQRFTSLGLGPSPIEVRPAIDHEVFNVREPAGHVITFFSSHASGQPV
jgi:hypothetical protein